MLLRLEAIKFNHDSSSANADALNIRRNESKFVEVPEWYGVSTNPADSPAAYALSETQGNTITIEANFSCDEPSEAVYIRALDPHIHQAPVNGHLSTLELQLLQNVAPNSAGNMLGEVKSHPVTFSGGETGFQPFDFKNVRIQDAGVSVENIVWRWQYCLGGTGSWIDFAVTTHRIYTVLREPGLPWLTTPHKASNSQLLWSDVLDHACDWAAGAQNPDIAAAMITERVHQLGPEIIRYAGSPHYTNDLSFNCSCFLERLAGQCGKGKRVNCDDCAAIVSTFANAVGCDLSQMFIRPVGKKRFFSLKPHRRIGIEDSQTGNFFHHEVASEGECREADEVFDACLQVGSEEPGVFTVPTNLRFGNVREFGYRFSLVVTPEAIEPAEALCKQRTLGNAAALTQSGVDRLLMEEHFNFASWKNSDAPGRRHFISDFFFADYILPGLQLELQKTDVAPSVIHSFWRWNMDSEETLLRIDVYETASWRDARKGLMTILTTLQPGMVQQQSEGFGDVVFADPAFEEVLFGVGNMVFFLRNVGRESVSLVEVAQSINRNILAPPPGTELGVPDGIRRFKFASSAGAIDAKIKLKEEPEEPAYTPSPKRLYQFIADKGEISLEGEELIYRPNSPGLNTLKIFAADAKGDAVVQTLLLNVS